MSKTEKRRVLAENLLIAFLGLLALSALVLSNLPFFRGGAAAHHLPEIERMTVRLFSFVTLAILYSLFRRRRAAWWLTVCWLVYGLARQLLLPHRLVFSYLLAGVDALCLLLLFYFQADFCCPAPRGSLVRSIGMLALAAAGILFNAGVSYHFARLHDPAAPRGLALWDSLTDACGILFGVSEGSAEATRLGRFETVMFWFSWSCMLLALIYVLRPWIARFLWTETSMRRARALVLAYGQNSSSYLTLEKDKLLYFGRSVEGVLPYGIAGGTVVVNGDPICAPADFPAFLAEFCAFCRKSDHRLFFLSVSPRFLDEYRKQGFGIAKCGEEACFELASYDIAGKKGAKMRMNINHATKAGVTVAEYRPLEKRDAEVESAMARITSEWLGDKKSGLLSFTMGTTGLDDPLDRRYFYARDASGAICGFNVYCPYDGGRSYMADITRRTHDAPGGVTEKIMYEAFAVFRREGAVRVSLGIAPLANLVPEGARPNSVEWLLRFVYEHLNGCYGFKNLYRAKENYSPTEWVPGYYAWLPRIPTPAMFYAVVRVQNPQGMAAFLLSILRAQLAAKRGKC